MRNLIEYSSSEVLDIAAALVLKSPQGQRPGQGQHQWGDATSQYLWTRYDVGHNVVLCEVNWI